MACAVKSPVPAFGYEPALRQPSPKLNVDMSDEELNRVDQIVRIVRRCIGVPVQRGFVSAKLARLAKAVKSRRQVARTGRCASS